MLLCRNGIDQQNAHVECLVKKATIDRSWQKNATCHNSQKMNSIMQSDMYQLLVLVRATGRPLWDLLIAFHSHWREKNKAKIYK
jgi:hypothetical protein